MMNGALTAGLAGLVVGLRLAQVAAEQAHGLLQVVDVVRPHGILAVGVLEQFFGRDDHGIRFLLGSIRGKRSTSQQFYR